MSTEALAWLKDLGVPAMVAGVGQFVVRMVVDARRSESTKDILDWLAADNTRRASDADTSLLEALLELERAVSFERAFGVRAESTRRAALVAFWKDQSARFTMREVGKASQHLVWDGKRFLARPEDRRFKPSDIRFRRWVLQHWAVIWLFYFGVAYVFAFAALNSDDTQIQLLFGATAVLVMFASATLPRVFRRLEAAEELLAWSDAVPGRASARAEVMDRPEPAVSYEAPFVKSPRKE